MWVTGAGVTRYGVIWVSFQIIPVGSAGGATAPTPPTAPTLPTKTKISLSVSQ